MPKTRVAILIIVLTLPAFGMQFFSVGILPGLGVAGTMLVSCILVWRRQSACRQLSAAARIDGKELALANSHERSNKNSQPAAATPGQAQGALPRKPLRSHLWQPPTAKHKAPDERPAASPNCSAKARAAADRLDTEGNESEPRSELAAGNRKPKGSERLVDAGLGLHEAGGASDGSKNHAVNELRELLWYGMRLFHAQTGARRLAIGVLEKVLNNTLRVPSFRLSAACLLGEIYRGQADFTQAIQCYQLSISESEAIPESERSRNEWYAHYRPRAALGLALAWRRTLGAWDQIRGLLRETRENFARNSAPDLRAQLIVLEGLLDRQLNDSEGAQIRLKDALESLRGTAPPYLLLWPEHIRALLAQVCLTVPESRPHAIQHARELLLSGNNGPWTYAVSASVLLHSKLDRVLQSDAPQQESVIEVSRCDRDGAGGLLQRLEQSAAAEGDPFLLTESSALHAAWFAAAGDGARAAEYIDRLCEQSEAELAPLVLLRAVEAATSWRALGASSLPSAALSGLLNRGKRALELLAPNLSSYRCEDSLLEGWRRHLSLGSLLVPLGEDESWWLSAELQALRQRAWP